MSKRSINRKEAKDLEQKLKAKGLEGLLSELEEVGADELEVPKDQPAIRLQDGSCVAEELYWAQFKAGLKKVTRVVGIDVGDRKSRCCVMDMASGVVLNEFSVKTTRKGIRECFEGSEPMLIVIEVCTHSTWMHHEFKRMGHEPVTANPRRVKLISQSKSKNDRKDAKMLAELGRLDISLLSPVRIRDPKSQGHLAAIRSRDLLVRERNSLTNHIRGTVKIFGERLDVKTTGAFRVATVGKQLPKDAVAALLPMLRVVEVMNEQIKEFDKKIREWCKLYPEAMHLQQIDRVGPITSLTFVLLVEDPRRFKYSRKVSANFGLVPRLYESSTIKRQCRITKCGDRLMRRLLVQCAQQILGPFGPDCDLRRFGERLIREGNARSKKGAVIAVARKLAALMHMLWLTGVEYDPDYLLNLQQGGEEAAS